MSKPIAAIKKADPTAATKKRRLFLALTLGSVLGFRTALYLVSPDRPSEFDALYAAAVRLLGGQNPYPIASQWFPYPLPAVLLAVPFTAIPLALARLVLDVLVGWAFAYALWKHRGTFALLGLASGAYLFAAWYGHVTPLLVAASLIPALGFLLAVKPNTSAALWAARPSRIALLGVIAFLLVSVWILPSWPGDWWAALQQNNDALVPLVFRPFGLVLVLAALRWRLPEGRLLLATAFIPMNPVPHELVALALIPANLLEMGIFVLGSWSAVALTAPGMDLSRGIAHWSVAGWSATLGAVYLPMLFVVLRRPSGKVVVEKERRRPYRLSDEELKVDVTQSPAGGVTVKVTHLPTRLSAAESGKTREIAERKAHDRLAGILAGMRRDSEKEA